MAPRPLRNATISFGLVNIPVRFYTATRSEDLQFNLLHESCGSRVNRRWWCPKDEAMIESSELTRAYQVEKNRYVTLTDEEIDVLENDQNRALEIVEFVSLAAIDPVFFEKAYYLGPGAGGAKTYRLLAAAMRKQNKVAVARWIAGHREHLVVLRPYEQGLVLHTMYYADEVRDFGEIDVEQAEPQQKEIALAEMLINELTLDEFDPLAFRDEYRHRLMEKITAKAEGGVIVAEAREESGPPVVVDIMEALRRSLEGGAGRKRAPAKRAPSRAPSATKEKPKSTSRKRRVS